ncbi:endospore germination permease [Halocella sp. SP3-1]|uniref:GerAB/ArcD/ProY family transporter n=1 Tax=Halocella sp. SP3-1 TaxID=2382161 RepID=UPI000F760D25|nr:endospore germination permease [Halocella sp. SP3-1]AZO94973.1 hypothetical protein D7D81_10435 [Halocella sp. SP3-1]
MPQISKSQLALLFINIIIPAAHIQVLSVSVKYSKNSAWIAVLAAYLIIAILSFVTIKLIKLYPQDSILDFSSKIMGKTIGKLFNIILFFYSFLIASFMLEQFTILVTTMVYRMTPAYILRTGIMILAVYLVSLGVEVIFRVSDIIFIIVIVFTIVIGIGLLKEIDFKMLLPIFTVDLKNFIKSTIMPMVFFGQIIIFLFFHNLLEDLSSISKTIQLSLLVGSIFVFLFVLVDLMVFGADLASRMLFPPYMLIRFINIEEVLDRAEVFMLTLWIALSFIETAVYFWISNQAIIKVFNLKYQKLNIIPLAIILLALTTVMWREKGIIGFQQYVQLGYAFSILSVQLFVPVCLYLTALFRTWKGVVNE